MEPGQRLQPKPPLEERDLETRLADIRLVVFELEGVATDGTVCFGPDGGQSLVFRRPDMIGVAGLVAAGYTVIGLARHDLPAAEAFCRATGATLAVHKDDKANLIQLLGVEHQVKPMEVLYMGVDLDDLGAMFQVGLAACPAEASHWVRAAAQLVTQANGGRGALRELCDLLLREQSPKTE